MSVVGTIGWIVLVLLVLHLAVPSAMMRRDPTGNGLYYMFWAVLVSGMLDMQYQVMAQGGHGAQALWSDAVAIILFVLGQLTLVYLRRRWPAGSVIPVAPRTANVDQDSSSRHIKHSF